MCRATQQQEHPDHMEHNGGRVLQVDQQHQQQAKGCIFRAIGLRAHAFHQAFVAVIAKSQLVGTSIHNDTGAEREEHQRDKGAL